MAIYLFDQRLLQVIVRKGEIYEHEINLFLSAIIHLNPFQAVESADLGFTWITEILNSGHSEDARYQMASKVVRSLGNYFFPEAPAYSPHVKSIWIPPLLNFLFLCEKFYTEETYLPHPGFLALRIISSVGNLFILLRRFCLSQRLHYSRPILYNRAAWLWMSSTCTRSGGSPRR